VAAAVSAQPEHGSLAEEAARLVAALQQATAGWSSAAGFEAADGDEPHEPHGHAATPAACRVCPLCQLIAMVQNVRPETVQHLSDAAASLAAAASDLLAGAAERRTERPRQDDEPAPSRPQRDDVQHIDIDD